MRRTVLLNLLALLLIISCATTKQQNAAIVNAPKYVPFREFRGDTAAYIKQNFEARKQYYIGKKLKVLLNDLELPVKHCSLSYNYLKYNGKRVYAGGLFEFCGEEVSLYNLSTTTPKNTYGCDVEFAPPYVVDDPILSSLRKYGTIWNKESRKALEQAIITDVKLSNWRNSMGVMKQ